ILAKFLHTL
nr:Chain C, ILE-LEU-ALA-LYS-PHE-LEU-HIS-THR-LEU [Homo sapiens]